MNINYLFLFKQEINDHVHVEDSVHQPDEDHASFPGNEFIDMLLFCIDNCRWWKLILNLHNSNTKHVDTDDNDEHANVPMLGKKHLCHVFLNELLVFIKIKIN